MIAERFAVLGEPIRCRILEELRGHDRSVSDLVGRLAVSQPLVSKHLRILRQAGFVSSTIAAQRRIYRIEPKPFKDIDAWLARYRRLWSKHLDALERHLDRQENS